MNFNLDRLSDIIESLSNDLGEGLVGTDIWAAGASESLAYLRGNESSPGTIALFNEVSQKLDKALRGADFPQIGNYYLISLADSHIAVVLLAGSFQQFILIDLSKTTMGVLMSVALPNLIRSLANANIKEIKQRGNSPLWKLLNAWSMGAYNNQDS